MCGIGSARNVLTGSAAKKGVRGELVQMDGSHHDWFEGRGPVCVLMATLMMPQEKSTLVLRVRGQNTASHGQFQAVYQAVWHP